jgi:hypothetical protein
VSDQPIPPDRAVEPSFDADRYLRLLGERALLDGEAGRGGPIGTPLSDAAAALVAVGAAVPERASEVVAAYELAARLRGPDGLAQPLRPRPPRALRVGSGFPEGCPPSDPAVERLVACEACVATGTGLVHVRYARFTEEATVLGVLIELDGPRGRVQARRGAGRAPAHMTLRDDRGTSATAGFSGGGDRLARNGTLRVQPGLATDSAWLELEGERIELGDPVEAPPAYLVPLPEGDPALRHVWARIATGERIGRHHLHLEAIISALVACGALRAHDPDLAAARAIDAALQMLPVTTTKVKPHPEPWRSLLARRGAHDGPVGVRLVGAVSPLFDGVRVAVIALESCESEFHLEVETRPGIDGGLGPARLQWWAADDRGGHYLGSPGRWGSAPERSEGEVSFWPALHPAASTLRVLPTGATARAVFEIDLPW